MVQLHEPHKKGDVNPNGGPSSKRTPRGRPSSVNVISIGQETIDVTTHVWSKEHRTFVTGPHKCFKRSEYVAAE